MIAVVRNIVDEIAEEFGTTPELILGKCRAHLLMQARVEVAKRLDARGWSSKQIGRVLNRDHTTIIFYLGRGKKKPSKVYWRAPRVRHLCWIRTKPKKEQRKFFLIPYAGYDPTEYKWRRNAA